MRTEIVCANPKEWKGKSLVEILGGLCKSQQEYICLRLRGMGSEEAIKVINRKIGTLVEVWTKEEAFNDIFWWLYNNPERERYAQEALVIFTGNLSVKAQELLNNLLDMGIERWEGLDKTDKSSVMRAIDIVTKKGGEGREGGSYEEIIMRRRLEK